MRVIAVPVRPRPARQWSSIFFGSPFNPPIMRSFCKERKFAYSVMIYIMSLFACFSGTEKSSQTWKWMCCKVRRMVPFGAKTSKNLLV